MKKNFGKIALLTAAMAVTVPTAVALSACGGDNSKKVDHVADSVWQVNDENHWHACVGNDDHKYDLGGHTWTVNGEIYTCPVCEYSKTVTGANNQHVQILQSAYKKLAEYQGAVTVSGVSIDPETGEEYEMSSSIDPTEKISYSSSPEGVMKVVKKGDNCILYMLQSQSEDGEDESEEAVAPKASYRLLDEATLNEIFGSVESGLDGFAGVDTDALFEESETALDSATFAARFLEVARDSFENNGGYTLDETKASITYTVVDGILTVTGKVQSEVKNGSYLVSTVIFKANVNSSTFVSMSVKANMVVVGDETTETKTFTVMDATQSYGFDRAGYDEIDHGTIPAEIGYTYVFDKVVEIKWDEEPGDDEAVTNMVKNMKTVIVSGTEVEFYMSEDYSSTMQYVIADGKITVTEGEGEDATIYVFTMNGDTFTGEIELNGCSAVITFKLSK